MQYQYAVIRIQPHTDSLTRSQFRKRKVVAVSQCCYNYNVIGTPHPLHTHIRFTAYIYKVFQHILLLCPVVIRTQPHDTDICSLRMVVSLGVQQETVSFHMHYLLSCDWELGHPIHFILISDLFHTCIMCLSTFYRGQRSYYHYPNN